VLADRRQIGNDLDKVALRLNQRPRKTLGFETPASKLQASVASTG
jgi:IS30 family transposase